MYSDLCRDVFGDIPFGVFFHKEAVVTDTALFQLFTAHLKNRGFSTAERPRKGA